MSLLWHPSTAVHSVAPLRLWPGADGRWQLVGFRAELQSSAEVSACAAGPRVSDSQTSAHLSERPRATVRSGASGRGRYPTGVWRRWANGYSFAFGIRASFGICFVDPN